MIFACDPICGMGNSILDHSRSLPHRFSHFLCQPILRANHFMVSRVCAFTCVWYLARQIYEFLFPPYFSCASLTITSTITLCNKHTHTVTPAKRLLWTKYSRALPHIPMMMTTTTTQATTVGQPMRASPLTTNYSLVFWNKHYWINSPPAPSLFQPPPQKPPLARSLLFIPPTPLRWGCFY